MSRLPVHTSLPLASNLRQIDALQVLRAVAVILVAWAHAAQNIGVPPHFLDFGVFGIDLFFVISGFILSSVVLRERGRPGWATMWNFMKRRLIRIFPIYWFFALLTIARLALAHNLPDSHYIPAFFLLPSLSTTYTPLIVAFSWTLAFEMFFYYTLSLILLFTVRYAVPLLILILGCVVSVGGLFFDVRHPVWILVCNPMNLEFVFGAAVALLYARLQHRKLLGRVVTLVGIASACALALHPFALAANGPQMILNGEGVLLRVVSWGLAATLIVAGLVLWSPSCNRQPARVLVILGTASYSAYLASPLSIEYASRLFLKFRTVPASHFHYDLGQCLLVIAVLCIGWLCYNFVEWPMIRFFQSKLVNRSN